MIHVTFIKNALDELCGFRMKGHAEYAKSGEDIVCAGVSALVINTINSIEAFTEDVFSDDIQEREEDVVFFAISSSPVSEASKLLLESLRLGLRGIESDYGNKFIELDEKCEEV